MQELDDIALLREYVERDSEEAFTTLVTRHVDRVYSVALRHTSNPHQAEEITQAVFVILARKSRHLGKSVILSGWLYQTARLTAVTLIRSEIRRARREQEAHMQTGLNENESDVWMQIAPLLDSAMAALNEKDRHAVVLRFFDGKSMREVGAALDANEDAAEKRVGRALEKLRKCFTKQGVILSVAVLTAAISENSVQAAPAMLAKAMSAAAFAKGATASISTLTLVKGTLKIMTYAKLKLATGVAAGILLAGGAATLVLASGWGGDHLSPDAILKKTQEKYASLTTYSDEGKTIATLNGIANTTAFTIKLARPNLYRIEWEQNNEPAFFSTKTQAVWSAGEGDFLTTGFGARKQSSQESALGGAIGISGSVGTIIPETFFKMSWDNQLGGWASSAKRQANEKVGDLDCYVLASELKGTTKTLWIGKRDFLIHQVQTVTSVEPGKTAPTEPANFRPEIIAELEKAGFPGITSTEIHTNIVINKSFSKADFDYQVSIPFLK